MIRNVCEDELFLGLCFFLSTSSRDRPPESCLVVKGKRIVSGSASSKCLLGELEGSAEFLSLSKLNDEKLFNCEIYIDHTPSPLLLSYLSKFTFNRIVYFSIEEISSEINFLKSSLVRFSGNLNWIRDKVSDMKGSDIFS